MASNENKKQVEEQELQEVLAPENTDTSAVDAEEKKDETPEKDQAVQEDASAEAPATEPGLATFEKAKKSQTALIAAVALIAFLAVALFLNSMGTGFGSKQTYENSVHGYSYSYPEDLELVAEGNIPQELKDQGVENMAQLNLTQGDSLLVRKTEDGGDNIVYTVLELSSRPNFGDFESYTTALFASLDESKELNGIDYVISDSTVGGDIPSTEYSFEMEVPIDAAGNTRTGVFYDNVFQTPDGRAYSISFGYPKDVPNPEEYVAIYRDILSSFEGGEGEATTEELGDAGVEDMTGEEVVVEEDMENLEDDTATEETVEVVE
jgi:hypothetical protein